MDIGTDEVWKAIKEMPLDRVPGTDDFTGAFYKSAWAIIRDDIMAAIKAFTDGQRRGLPKLNNALIVLLPKKVGASTPADYRPITLIHSFAKLFSKVLALGLRQS